MTNIQIAHLRLQNQQLAATTIRPPAEIVRWMGAVQSQDYRGGRWAVCLRSGVTADAFEQALKQGSIIRLHVLRPTWHFVTAEDARWMLALTGPRVLAGMASRHRDLELNRAVFDQCQDIFRQVLAGGRAMTRIELEAAFNQAGISTHLPQRFVHILMEAELHGVLCNGPWKGNQATYALLDERVPPMPSLEREPALAELARRFFTSHGPATLKDYCWWSGLNASDARTGIHLAGDSLESMEIDGRLYFTGHSDRAGIPGKVVSEMENTVSSSAPSAAPQAHLLPNFDEYVVAYSDRSAIFDPALSDQLRMRGGALNNVLILDGLVTGSWSRTFKKNTVDITLNPLWQLSSETRQATDRAVQRYADHLNLAANLHIEPPDSSTDPE